LRIEQVQGGEKTEEDMDEYNEELHHEEQAGPKREVNDENSFSTLGFPIGDLPRGVAAHEEHSTLSTT
jgi:hypothetical protein